MKTIQSRLLVMLVIFIIVPYFISVLLIYWYTKENVERHELTNSQNQLQKVSEDLEQYFQDLINLPYILYRNPDLFRVFEKGFENSIYSNQLEIDKGMKTFYLMRSEIRQVQIYMAKGEDSFTVYNAMVSARKRQPDFMKQGSIQRLLASESNDLIEPPHQIRNYNNSAIMPQSDKTMVLTIHHKIVDVLSNEFLGIVTVDIDLDRIARACNRFIEVGNESVFLTDSDGHVIYATDQTIIGKSLSTDLNQWTAKTKTDDILLSKTLIDPLEQWQLVKVTSSDYLYDEVRQTASTNIVLGIGVVLLGLLMVNIIAYKIASPIKLLSRKVRRIEGGNMNVPFAQTRDDEIGHLEKHIKEMMNRINLHIEREYKLVIENRTNQFRALMSQINPHFLHNALQSIGAVALRANTPEVYRLVTSLSKMMRYTIRVDQWTTVQREVEYVQAYLNLQMERFRTDFSYSIEIDEELLDIRVPTMILQPLVENFFKHCYEEGWYEAHLRIYGETREELLTLTVENDGPGLSGEELIALRSKVFVQESEGTHSHNHIGLKNIHDRLVLNYGKPAGIELDSNDGQGFIVRLVIPLTPKEGVQQ